MKNLAKDLGLNILTCVRMPLSPCLARHFPSQRQSVSLCFHVAMLLKTQFACHRLRGKLILRKKAIKFYICTRIYVYLLPDSSLRVTWCFFSCHYSCSVRRSRMTAGVNWVSKECFICFAKKNRKRKPSPLVGEGGGASRRKGQVGADPQEWK